MYVCDTFAFVLYSCGDDGLQMPHVQRRNELLLEPSQSDS